MCSSVEEEVHVPASEQVEQQQRPDDIAPEAPEASTTNLGPCHYGGADEKATVMATRDDGTGWIGVCDEHRRDAENDGFTVEGDNA
jgi:hypothetical protein